MGVEVGYLCVKGSPYSISFSMGSGGVPGLAMQSWVCGAGGPVCSEYFICTDSALQIDGYSNVYAYANARPYHLNLEPDTNRSSTLGTLYKTPILPTSPYTLSKTYYAKGVGIIRREIIDENGKVLEFVKLTSFKIP